ncbi:MULTISPECIES: hypothetical protein [unclassified Nocardia]|uniref:hypothetical protein n=1 Tax=unclassified Nocardia TaxID=2637762 RepID=UPI00278BAEAB|nr:MULTISPECIES: hypothetical protein [unclassified Nocardia]
MTANPERVSTEKLLAGIGETCGELGESTEPVDADSIAMLATMNGLATATALLAVERRLGELVAHQQLMTVVNAIVTGAATLTDAERQAARAYIRRHILSIVQPITPEETP